MLSSRGTRLKKKSSSCHIYFIYFSNIFSYENYFVKYRKTVVLLFQATLFIVLNKLFSNLSETGHTVVDKHLCLLNLLNLCVICPYFHSYTYFLLELIKIKI